MSNAATDEIELTNLEGCTRAQRWEHFRDHLNQAVDLLDSSDNVENPQCDSARNMLIRLSELALIEVQREASMTLNADDEIVHLGFCEEDGSEANQDELSCPIENEEDFLREMTRLPGVGSKLSVRIGEYLSGAGAERFFAFARALWAVNHEISTKDGSQPQLCFEDDGAENAEVL